MPNEQAACPYCGQTFQAPAGHDPLKKHFDYCEAIERQEP
jgi:hypothetical protein